MHKHDVVQLSEVSRGQAAVALLRLMLQRGVSAQDALRLELEVSMTRLVRAFCVCMVGVGG